VGEPFDRVFLFYDVVEDPACGIIRHGGIYSSEALGTDGFFSGKRDLGLFYGFE
jgi:hypothetical protein